MDRINKPGRQTPLNQVGGVTAGLLVSALLFLNATTTAQAHTVDVKPTFDAGATSQCVLNASGANPSLNDYRVLECVGQSSQACFKTPSGDTTVGMMSCLQAELAYWQQRLREAYDKRLNDAQSQDAELRSIGSSAGSMASSLTAMQNAWVKFRDAACIYEQAQWMGGSGGGPATLSCHVHETAEFALKMEGWWTK